jgi:predicted ATPase/DNA-binding SARP family transcriptional activator
MARLSLSLLGSFHVSLDGAAITTFESDKVRALLAYLAVEGHQPHRRASLVGLLWPDSSEGAARRNLSQALFNLRQAIGDAHATPPYLQISRDQLQFNTASDHMLDVATFTALLNACDAHPHQRIDRCGPCAQRLQQAVALYRGNFLQHFFLADSAAFEEWTLLRREAMHRRGLEALAHLADYYEQRGGYEEARRYAIRQLELDPWREEAHRQLLRVLALSGQRSAALAQYETCRRALADELDVEPSEETTTLYRHIQRGELQAEPVVTRPARSDNLPTALTPFVGRTQELSELAQLLADPACRLLTLVGPGGIGKTRLALQSAMQHREAFAQGVAFVPLAPISSAGLIVSTIAAALGVALHGSTDPETQLLNSLREQHMLLVLDNFEHLLDGVDLLVELLRQAPQLKMLVTSREPLQLHGEWVFEVNGLPVPADDQPQEFDLNDATTLFLQRARRAQAGFALTDAERPAVVRICRLVDGLPLAIELAAVWVRTLACVEIAYEIQRGLDFLRASARDIPTRHHSLRAVFDHSWHLLSEDERRVLRRLSVFRGGFQREAAEHVAGAPLSLLSSLVAKSLLRRTEAGRYDLHEVVRQYAREQLRAGGEEPTIRRRHAQYFIGFAASAQSELHGPDEIVWFRHLDEDHDNMREVFRWALEPQPKAEASERFALSARLAAVVYNLWFLRGYHAEGMAQLQQLLAEPAASERTAARAQVLTAFGFIQWAEGHFAQAESFLAEAVQISRDVGDRQTCAMALNGLGHSLKDQGHYAPARARLEESLSIWQELGDRLGVANSIRDLADIARAQGDAARARQLFVESAGLYKDLQVVNQSAYPLRRLAYYALADGNAAQAAAQCLESLQINCQIKDPIGIAASVGGLAAVALEQRNKIRAARLFGAVEAILSGIVAPLLPADRLEYERNVTALRAQLGEADFAAAWDAGRAMTIEQAIAYAREGSDVGFVASIGTAAAL